MTDAKLASGPAGSEQYAHPWLFQDYVPDVMVRPFVEHASGKEG
jgi:hypothetical protein